MLCQLEILIIKLKSPATALLSAMLFVGFYSWSQATVGETGLVERGIDTRKVFSETSPRWLAAVGKLHVPSIKMVNGHRSNHREDCSATLVSTPGAKAADTIITAWHCLEFYKDLSKNITFTLLPASGTPISALVRRLADGGSMHSDWAILRLHKPVASEQVSPLLIHPSRLGVESLIAMAGYSSDPGLGQGGDLLTYDPKCTVTVQVRNSSNSNCRAFRGASGGAVVQLSSSGEAWLSGVISQGDGQEMSTFIPVARFRSAINQYLR